MGPNIFLSKAYFRTSLIFHSPVSRLFGMKVLWAGGIRAHTGRQPLTAIELQIELVSSLKISLSLVGSRDIPSLLEVYFKLNPRLLLRFWYNKLHLKARNCYNYPVIREVYICVCTYYKCNTTQVIHTSKKSQKPNVK